MKHYDSSMPKNNAVSQAQGSVNKLSNAVSQALSHPSEQTLQQAEQCLTHTEQAVQDAVMHSEDGQGVELVQEALNEEKERLQGADAALHNEQRL